MYIVYKKVWMLIYKKKICIYILFIINSIEEELLQWVGGVYISIHRQKNKYKETLKTSRASIFKRCELMPVAFKFKVAKTFILTYQRYLLIYGNK